MAIPLHQIIVLGLNKKTLKQVQKIVRSFLWAGRADANGGHCHVNWAKVCRPLRYGGLGVPDLARTAISLRTRWIWRMRTDPLRPWRGLDMHFSKAELEVFDASTKMVVGDGETALFWADRWLDGKAIREIAPDLFALIPKRTRKRRTVVDCRYPGRAQLAGPLSICPTLDKGEGCRPFGTARYSPLEMDVGRAVLIQILLRVPLPWSHSIEILEAELAHLGPAAGQVLHLARLSGQMLDG